MIEAVFWFLLAALWSAASFASACKENTGVAMLYLVCALLNIATGVLSLPGVSE